MSKAGDVYENPVTGERAVVRVSNEELGGGLVICDLYVSPGGAVAGEHVHPGIEEAFGVCRGRALAGTGRCHEHPSTDTVVEQIQRRC